MNISFLAKILGLKRPKHPSNPSKLAEISGDMKYRNTHD
jgi:hypothetical protein